MYLSNDNAKTPSNNRQYQTMSFRGGSRGGRGTGANAGFSGGRGGGGFGGRGGGTLILVCEFPMINCAQLLTVYNRTRRFPTKRQWSSIRCIWYDNFNWYCESQLLILEIAMGSFLHASEGEIVCESINTKIPYFNAPIYLENKVRIPNSQNLLEKTY